MIASFTSSTVFKQQAPYGTYIILENNITNENRKLLLMLLHKQQVVYKVFVCEVV